MFTIRKQIASPIFTSLLLLSNLACNDSSSDDSSPAPEEPSQRPEPTSSEFELQPGGSGQTLVVFGDSISTGVLAETTLGEQPSQDFLRQLIEAASSGNFSQDSLQKDFSRPQVAAATTAEDYGVAAAIAAKEGIKTEEIRILSAAKFGGRLKDVASMRDGLTSSVGDDAVEHVFFMLGSNDFCADSTVEKFSEELRSSLESLSTTFPDAQFIVGYLPPIAQLAQYEYDYGPSIGGAQVPITSCEEFRNNTCGRLYTENAAEVVTSFNDSIRTVAQDVLADRAFLAEKIINWQIQENELAFDCFHPNRNGQTTLGGFFQDIF